MIIKHTKWKYFVLDEEEEEAAEMALKDEDFELWIWRLPLRYVTLHPFKPFFYC